jgi:hypothetical protein
MESWNLLQNSAISLERDSNGLSGRRFSRWYRSDIARWLAGELKVTEVSSCPTP